MENWAWRVLTDHRLSKTEMKVAWALSFGFNNDDGKNWQTKAVIAKFAGLSESSVKAALTALDQYGHISRTFEIVRGKNVRVIRPTMTRQIGSPEPRQRSGGVAKGVDTRRGAAALKGPDPQAPRGPDPQAPERTDPQAPRGTDPQAPCIHESSWTNPGSNVAGGITVPPPPEDDIWEDDQLPEKAG